MALTPEIEEAVNAALEAHNKVRRFELDNREHAFLMLFADMIEYADGCDSAVDMLEIFERAQDLVRETRT